MSDSPDDDADIARYKFLREKWRPILEEFLTEAEFYIAIDNGEIVVYPVMEGSPIFEAVASAKLKNAIAGRVNILQKMARDDDLEFRAEGYWELSRLAVLLKDAAKLAEAAARGVQNR